MQHTELWVQDHGSQAQWIENGNTMKQQEFMVV